MCYFEDKEIIRVLDIDAQALISLLDKFGLSVMLLPGIADPIPGTFWGEPEAGLIGKTIYARQDTPVHSVLHESCHYICMDNARRQRLHTNAGGGYEEECAVCYLQILLADELPALNKNRIMADMDTWGYSFRLGSTSAWFHHDADETVQWLIKYKVIGPNGKLTWQIRY